MIILNQERLEAIQYETFQTPIQKIAIFLQENLGQQITAYLSGLKDPKVVGLWKKGEVEPHFLTQTRLRHAYQAARMLIDAYGVETTKSWFFGTNTRLNDEAPAYLLRNAKTPADFRFIVPAARAFAGAVD